MASDFPSHSPYNYVFNNPLSFVDPDGRAPENLILDFQNDEARDAFVGLMEKSLGGYYNVHISSDGKVNLWDNESATGEISGSAKRFLEVISPALDSEEDVNIKVRHGDPNVATGRASLKSIDVADMLQFNENTDELGGTQSGKLAHEIVEEYEMQVNDMKVGTQKYGAHRAGIDAEDYVNNSTRKDPAIFLRFGAYQDYSRGGKTVRTEVTYKTSSWFTTPGIPIISVKNKPHKNK